MSRIRTFIAVDIGAAVRRQAKTLIQTLAACTTAVRWVSAENLHVTLKFLGDVEDRDVYGICQAVGQAVAGRRPFHCFCRGVGAFPHAQRPRTLWLGLEDPAGQLADLQARIEETVAELGYPREVRQFRAHLTIGRVDVRHRRLGRLVDELPKFRDLEFGHVAVDECVVYASELTPDGPIYTPMGRMPLSGQ